MHSMHNYFSYWQNFVVAAVVALCLWYPSSCCPWVKLLYFAFYSSFYFLMISSSFSFPNQQLMVVLLLLPCRQQSHHLQTPSSSRHCVSSLDFLHVLLPSPLLYLLKYYLQKQRLLRHWLDFSIYFSSPWIYSPPC